MMLVDEYGARGWEIERIPKMGMIGTRTIGIHLVGMFFFKAMPDKIKTFLAC